jgi:hypothetical protein
MGSSDAPQTEDIAGRVNVSIEDVPAVADNLSYSQATDTFRPLIRQDATTRRDLGCMCLVDLKRAPAIPNGRVREHLLEARPAGIVDRLCHAGLSQFRRADVADNDESVFLDDLSTPLVQEILPPGGFGVNVADAFSEFFAPAASWRAWPRSCDRSGGPRS